MTWTAQTTAPVHVGVWSYIDAEGNRITQLSVGTANAQLTDEQRRSLVEYLDN